MVDPVHSYKGQPGMVSVTFACATDQNAALAAISSRTERSRSYLIRQAIDEYIARHQQEPADPDGTVEQGA